MILPDRLYYGALVADVHAARRDGIQPHNYYSKQYLSGDRGEPWPHAVFMFAADAIEELVTAISADIVLDLADEQFEEIGKHGDHLISESFFFQHAAIFVVVPYEGIELVDRRSDGAIPYAETISGSWYSTAPVHVAEILVGDELKDFLEARGLHPADLNEAICRDGEPRRSMSSTNRPATP
jgi:hypothetical protein